MDWQAIFNIVSPFGLVVVGFITYWKGSKGDKALNLATNIQTTFVAQKELIDNLQEDNGRINNRLVGCEKKCDLLIEELRESMHTVDLLTRKVEDHETTIKIQKDQIDLLTRGSK